VWRWDLSGEAFGNDKPDEDPDGDDTLFVLDLRYPGQQYDSATGFNYNYFRDYDPSTGRYSQSDPIGLAGGISTYGYVDGNPLVFTDTLGLINDNRLPSQAEIQREFQRARQQNLAMGELRRTYEEMLRKNVRGTDQFFHCMAACRASKASGNPELVLELMGQKEVRDYMLNIVGQYGDKRLSHADMMKDIGQDLAVNEVGAECPPGVNCLQRCRYLLNGLAPTRRPFMLEYRPDWRKP
jgi:RHS repeat-associated protein